MDVNLFFFFFGSYMLVIYTVFAIKVVFSSFIIHANECT